ncbi:MAG: hypothetical protein ACI9P9_000312 [Patescibacteria group bacterium]|jgi:hypothetical protein
MLLDFNMDSDEIYEKRKFVYAQLILLVFSMFSFPYVLGEVTNPSGSSDSFLFDSFEYVLDRLTTPVFALASAQVEGCCEELTSGASCVVAQSSSCKSDSNFAPGSVCTTTPFCQVGCCYDTDSGIYEKNVLQGKCNAEWAPDPFCNLPGASLGCCVLGASTKFETEGQCRVHTEVLALSSTFDVDWRTGLDEISCLSLAGEQKQGACVLPDGDCSFGNEASCIALSGDFAVDLLCTAGELDTVCEKTQITQCVAGKDGVYFVDTCGNIANIYDASRATDDSYWRTVVSVESSCNAANGGANSATCGNCDRFKGGSCALAGPDDFSVTMGDYYCRDTQCEYTDLWGAETTYENGESWCVYNSPIDEGDDAPGSRHFRYICNAGSVQVEPCADYRNEICIQQNTLSGQAADVVSGDSTEISFNNAVCRKNNAKNCVKIGESSMDACRDEPDCMVRSVKVGGSFDFDICEPKYPEGFSFEGEFQATGAQICAINTRTCVVSFAPLPFCICVDNCGCLNAASFDAQMDEVCESLGDCGNVPNYNEVRPERGKVATYDSRVEKYMQAAGLSYDDYLGVGSALFEQSAFSSAIFSTTLDPQKPDIPSNTAEPSGIGSMLTALGGMLAALAGVMGSTMMAIGGLMMSMLGGLLAAISPTVCPPILVPYSCNLWQPPTGGDACAACNGNADFPCTQYACRSLGAACDFINEGSGEELCVAGVDDGGFPIVTPILDLDAIIESENLYEFPELLDFIQQVDYVRLTENHLKITNLNGGCVEAYSPVPIRFDTHEPAQCKFDLEDKNFEDMQFFVGNSAYLFNHSTFFQLPDPSHGLAQNYTAVTDVSIYVKCRDRYGHEAPEFLQIDMCVFDGPDQTAPRVVNTRPKTNSVVSFDSESFELQVLTNELSTCRYSTSDVTYDLMENDLSCTDTFSSPSQPIGYVCRTDIPIALGNLSRSQTYFIKCADQPWLIGTEDEGERNANAQSFEFTSVRPSTKITIEEATPEGEITTVADQMSVDYSVETSGGGNTHICRYSFTGFDTMVQFFNTGVVGIHGQLFDLPPNKYDVFIECEDETGDVAQSTSSFRILQKNFSPIIARTWQNNDNLYFITQEEAECRYSEDSCFFDFSTGSVVSGDGVTHRVAASKGKDYYIKCKDNLDNLPSGCSAVLSSV